MMANKLSRPTVKVSKKDQIEFNLPWSISIIEIIRHLIELVNLVGVGLTRGLTFLY